MVTLSQLQCQQVRGFTAPNRALQNRRPTARRPSLRWGIGAIFVVGLHTLGYGVAHAQEHRNMWAAALVGGPTNYDLSGTGWSWGVAGRLDVPLARFLLLEPGLGFFTYRAQFDARFSFVLPELSLQAQLPGRTVRPYIGVGGGGAFVVRGPGDSEPTVHAAIGVRTLVTPHWGLRFEGRARNITVFEGNNSMLEFGFGISRRL